MNIEKIFDFIKERRGYNYPFKYKLKNRIPFNEDELKIRGDLDLYGVKITSLPDNLTVLGFLDIRFTEIKWLPDNLTVGRSIFGSYLNIDSIPNNLKVGRDLYLVGTPITEKYRNVEIRKMIEEKGGYVNDSLIA